MNRRFRNITMLNAVVEDGRHFHMFVTGPNNQATYAAFMEQLHFHMQRNYGDY